MKLSLRHEMSGQVIGVKDDPFEPDSFAWVDVSVDGHKHRLLVTQRFRGEHRLTEGRQFSWKFWNSTLLNFLLNPVTEITKDFPPSR